MTEPTPARMGRWILGGYAIAGPVLALVSPYTENIIIGIFLFFAGAVLSIGLLNRNRLAFVGTVVLFALISTPHIMFLATSTPFYARDSFTHPERSELIRDAVIPAIRILATGLPSLIGAVCFFARSSRKYFWAKKEEASNQAVEGTGVPRTVHPSPHR